MDETHVTPDRVLVVNQEMAFSRASAKPLGTVATIRDQTELLHLSGELAATRTLTDALRAQTHEFANRLHAVVALMELGRVDEAVRFASDELDRHTDVHTGTDRPDGDGSSAGMPEPPAVTPAVLAAVLNGKRAQAHERGVTLVADTSRLRTPVPGAASDVITVIGNLVDNAVDAVAEGVGDGGDPRVVVTVTPVDGGTRIVVEDNGPGIADVGAAYERGWSTKPSGPEGRGVGLDLVRSTVSRIGGAITVSTGPSGSTFVVDLDVQRVPA